jgi:hypothetical protein
MESSRANDVRKILGTPNYQVRLGGWGQLFPRWWRIGRPMMETEDG